MKKLRKCLPCILMIWPYLFLICFLLPEDGGGIYFDIYLLLTVVVYVMNIWNAFTFPEDDGGHRQAFWDMLLKLVHIPFYAGIFVIGVVLFFSMVVPVLTSPIIIIILAAIDYFLMLTSSMYGISAAIKAAKKGILSRLSAGLYSIFHCMFVADLVSAVLLHGKIKKELKTEEMKCTIQK